MVTPLRTYSYLSVVFPQRSFDFEDRYRLHGCKKEKALGKESLNMNEVLSFMRRVSSHLDLCLINAPILCLTCIATSDTKLNAKTDNPIAFFPFLSAPRS